MKKLEVSIFVNSSCTKTHYITTKNEEEYESLMTNLKYVTILWGKNVKVKEIIE